MDDCFALQVINCAFHQGKCTLSISQLHILCGEKHDKSDNVSTLKKRKTTTKVCYTSSNTMFLQLKTASTIVFKKLPKRLASNGRNNEQTAKWCHKKDKTLKIRTVNM